MKFFLDHQQVNQKQWHFPRWLFNGCQLLSRFGIMVNQAIMLIFQTCALPVPVRRCALFFLEREGLWFDETVRKHQYTVHTHSQRHSFWVLVGPKGIIAANCCVDAMHAFNVSNATSRVNNHNNSTTHWLTDWLRPSDAAELLVDMATEGAFAANQRGFFIDPEDDTPGLDILMSRRWVGYLDCGRTHQHSTGETII